MHVHDLSPQGVGSWVKRQRKIVNFGCPRPTSMMILVCGGDVDGLVCEMGMRIQEKEGEDMFV
jgi:hypothetical protein